MPDRYTFHDHDTHGVVLDTQTGEATRYDLVSDAEAAARRLNDQNRRPAMASEVDTSAARKLANVLIDDVNCGPNARYQPYTDGRMRDAAKMIRALAAERDAVVEAAVQAEREGIAKWHDCNATIYEVTAAKLTGANRDSFEGYAKKHREYAAAIRARGRQP